MQKYDLSAKGEKTPRRRFRRKKEPILTLIQMGRFETIVRRLKKKKIPVEDLERADTEEGLLPIHWACKHGSGLPKRALKALIEACPETAERIDNESSTPLHYLLYYGFSSVDALNILIKAYPGAIIERDQCGRTPIFHAIEHEEGRKVSVLELLLGMNTKAADALTWPCGPDLDGFRMGPTESRGFKFKQHNYNHFDAYWKRPLVERTPLHMIWFMALGGGGSDLEKKKSKRAKGRRMEKALLLLEFAYLNQVGGTVELKRALRRRRMAKKMIMYSRREVKSDGALLKSRRSVSPLRKSLENGVTSKSRKASTQRNRAETFDHLPVTSRSRKASTQRNRAETFDHLPGTISRSQSGPGDRLRSSPKNTGQRKRFSISTAAVLGKQRRRSQDEEGDESSGAEDDPYHNIMPTISQSEGTGRDGNRSPRKRFSLSTRNLFDRFKNTRNEINEDEESIDPSFYHDSNLNEESFGSLGAIQDLDYLNLTEDEHESTAIHRKHAVYRKKKFRPFRKKKDKGKTVKFRLVHAVVMFNEWLPAEVLEFAIQLKPEQLEQKDDLKGDLPLHIATSMNADPKIISMLIKHFRDAAEFKNASGQLPLHIALSNSSANINTINNLLEAFPHACQYKDPKSGLLPFMLAAAVTDIEPPAEDLYHSLFRSSRVIFENQFYNSSTLDLSQDESCKSDRDVLTLIYELILRDPNLVESGHH
eukprot:CAMPEP_0194126746 /NCGR_PEP_ID=MMETSP0150-20130528/60153_1 /TAXON_ID=122233 /ORGANISM="Chaetoceros debilis, Strain MM31A-1" /LENGTH=706 /DNA_ID=CAMNT_0038820625 /DNA_START=77 /DNA_END=2197 /DNA_ORIENTATION=+